MTEHTVEGNLYRIIKGHLMKIYQRWTDKNLLQRPNMGRKTPCVMFRGAVTSILRIVVTNVDVCFKLQLLEYLDFGLRNR